MLYSVELLGPLEDDGSVCILQTVTHEASNDEEAKRTVHEVFRARRTGHCYGFALVDCTGRDIYVWHNTDIRGAPRKREAD